MTAENIAEKIRKIESQLGVLKQSVRRTPDLAVDEKNWMKVERSVKAVRKALYQDVYGKK